MLGGVPTESSGGGFRSGAAPGATRTEQVPADSAVLAGREVRVSLRPYWDAGCGCSVALALRGALRGGTLTGVFAGTAAQTTVGEGPAGGRWYG